MSIHETVDMVAQMQEAADRAAQGIHDPVAAKLACEDMDRVSEEIFRRHGVLNIGVQAIREHRDA